MADCYLKENCPSQTGACHGEPDEGCPVYRYFRKLIQKEPILVRWENGCPHCPHCNSLLNEEDWGFNGKYYCNSCGGEVKWND